MEEHRDTKERAVGLSEKNMPREQSTKCKGPLGIVCKGIQETTNTENIVKNTLMSLGNKCRALENKEEIQ